jgi:hypothetical protein
MWAKFISMTNAVIVANFILMQINNNTANPILQSISDKQYNTKSGFNKADIIRSSINTLARCKLLLFWTVRVLACTVYCHYTCI